jgi:hypothetical protein
MTAAPQQGMKIPVAFGSGSAAPVSAQDRLGALPGSIWQRLRIRAEHRQITLPDLIRLDAWKQSNRDAPGGGVGERLRKLQVGRQRALPKNISGARQAARGKRID